jgi:hypothetical protein
MADTGRPFATMLAKPPTSRPRRADRTEWERKRDRDAQRASEAQYRRAARKEGIHVRAVADRSRAIQTRRRHGSVDEP